MSAKRHISKKHFIFTAILLVLVVSVWACKRGASQGVRFASTSDPGVNNAPINNGPPSSSSGPVVSYADVVSRVSPAVITIHSEMRVRAPQQYPFMDDPMFRQFFGDRTPQQMPEQRRSGLGSGVIISTDGYILTNHHVIDGAEQIKVDLNDGRTLDAKIVGTDPPSDLAVLKIDATNLPVLALGDSDKVRVGDVVLAIGNPLGIGQTVTMGIISAKGRQTGLSSGSFEDFLQTDAPINQGNSGGALVSTNSELVGINSQILSPSGGSIGIGFAIPSNMARSITDTLVKTGKVRRGQLGITVVKLNSDPAKELGIKETKGIGVAQVQPGSAADRAGLKKGDVIIGFNGVEMTDPNVFRNQVASTAPGSAVTLNVMRDGRSLELHATLGELTAPPPEPGR
ncbi:MAG TPA: Do family serine endopeptidase [Pyrinomonadaceae bacterium]|jgi:Do/DeqQ family serine protease